MAGMCGRAYATYTEDELRFRYMNEKPVRVPKLKPNFNLSPSEDALVLKVQDGNKEFAFHRWGLIPHWAKDEKIGYKMINARADTITEKPSYRNAFKSRRCIVPLSGFIEWKRDGETKRPFRIGLKDKPIMSVAAIWEAWGELHSFSIITTEANPFMERIHDRMPVILAEEDEDQWLDSECKEPEKLTALLKPCPSQWLEAVEISTLVNSPKNNRKEVLDPI